MTEPQKDDDDTKFNETLKRMLKTPPKPHKEKGDDPKVAAHRSGQKIDEKRQSPKDGGNVD